MLQALKSSLVALLFAGSLCAQVVITPPTPGSITASAGAGLSVTVSPDKIPATVFNVALTINGVTAKWTFAPSDKSGASVTIGQNAIGFSASPGVGGMNVSASATVAGVVSNPASVVFQ